MPILKRCPSFDNQFTLKLKIEVERACHNRISFIVSENMFIYIYTYQYIEDIRRGVAP